jgi:glycogen(starch) synthase
METSQADQPSTRRLRIGVVTNYHLEQVGGAEEVLDCLATLWQAAGHHVVLFCTPPRRRAVHRRPWSPTYDVVRMPRAFSSRFGLSRYVRRLHRAHRKTPFDVLLACDVYWAGHVARRFAQRAAVPYVVCSQGSDLMHGSRFVGRWLTCRRLIAALQQADGVVCISRYMQRQAHTLAAPRGLQRIIRNGWPDSWHQQPVPPRLLQEPYLLAMGRMVPLKGFQTVLDAFAALRPHYPNLALVLAGDGPYRQPLVQRARERGLPVWQGSQPPACGAGGVWFPGFVHGERKRALVGHALLGVSPSIRQEPMSLVLFEMLSSGVPVVGTNVGGTPDIVQPGVNGALVPPDDPAALQECLQRLLDDEPHRRDLAAAAASSVEPFRWSRIAQQYIELFFDVVDNRHAAPRRRAA